MLADNSSRLPVTDQGVVIPKSWLGEAREVEVTTREGGILLLPVGADTTDQTSSDPETRIADWGVDASIDDPLADASVGHDEHLYGSGW